MNLRFLFLTLTLLSGLTGCATHKTAVLDQAIESAAVYLVEKTGENGKFIYRVNTDPQITVGEGYNILRHAGTIYAMAAAQQRAPSPDLRNAIERAGRYLQKEAIGPVPGSTNLLAVWSRPNVTRKNAPLQAKLGGTGLGLVALLSIEEMQPGFTSLNNLRALGQFLVFMQKENGSFYSKYIPSTGGRNEKWVSLFYPGEAALGLLLLHEKDPSGKWAVPATAALDFLARSRQNSANVPADHWALLATEKLFALENFPLNPALRERLTIQTVQICETILTDQLVLPDQPDIDGAFDKGGRTAPAATRMEGLLAAKNILPPDHPMQSRIGTCLERAVGFLLRTQIRRGSFDGAFPRAIRTIDPTAKSAAAFSRRATEVRIDYVQHALSALIGWEQTLRDGSLNPSHP